MKAYKHNPTDSYLFPADPKVMPDAGAKLTTEQAAVALGVSPAEVTLLVDEGYLKTNREGLITGRAVKEFCTGLVPVNLIEAQASAPRSSLKVNPTTPRRNVATAAAPRSTRTAAKAMVEAETESDEPDTFTASCPSCDQDLIIAGDVLAFKCPNCGRKLTISRPTEADSDNGDPGDDEPRTSPGFLGIFGGRKGR